MAEWFPVSTLRRWPVLADARGAAVMERADIRMGLRGANIRIEKRRDATLAVCFENHYLRYRPGERSPKVEPQKPVPEVKNKARRSVSKSTWMKDFLKKKGPSIGKAIAVSNATS